MKPLSEIVTAVSQERLPQLSRQPDRVLARLPLENDRLSVRQLRQCGLRINFEMTSSLSVTSCEMIPGPDTDWSAVGKVIQQLLAPAPPEMIAEWLTELAVMTVSRKQDEGTDDLQVTALAKRLTVWPGDIVKRVLERWPDDTKWWPDWCDLRQKLVTETAQRHAIARAYKNWSEAPELTARRLGVDQPKPEARLIPIAVNTPEQREAPRLEGGKPADHAERLAKMQAALLGEELEKASKGDGE